MAGVVFEEIASLATVPEETVLQAGLFDGALPETAFVPGAAEEAATQAAAVGVARRGILLTEFFDALAPKAPTAGRLPVELVVMVGDLIEPVLQSLTGGTATCRVFRGLEEAVTEGRVVLDAEVSLLGRLLTGA
jgi:hypothetical protein